MTARSRPPSPAPGRHRHGSQASGRHRRGSPAPAPRARPTARDLVVVHRLEFPFWVTTLCQALWGACFAVGGADGLLAPAPLTAVAANVVILLAGLLLNTAADLDSDRRHPDRGTLATAAERLGRRRGLRLAAAEFTLGSLLAVVVSVWTGRWMVTAAAVGAVVAHVLYNVDPVRLKARGFAGAVVFALGAIALPLLTSYGAVAGPVPGALWVVFAGLTVAAAGRVVWWSVPDVDADAAAGLATTGVRRGPTRALALACTVLAGGVALLGAGLWWYAGAVAAVVGTAAHGVFLGGALRLWHRLARGGAASSRRLRRRAMPLVLVADVLLVGIGLTTG